MSENLTGSGTFELRGLRRRRALKDFELESLELYDRNDPSDVFYNHFQWFSEDVNKRFNAFRDSYENQRELKNYKIFVSEQRQMLQEHNRREVELLDFNAERIKGKLRNRLEATRKNARSIEDQTIQVNEAREYRDAVLEHENEMAQLGATKEAMERAYADLMTESVLEFSQFQLMSKIEKTEIIEARNKDIQENDYISDANDILKQMKRLELAKERVEKLASEVVADSSDVEKIGYMEYLISKMRLCTVVFEKSVDQFKEKLSSFTCVPNSEELPATLEKLAELIGTAGSIITELEEYHALTGDFPIEKYRGDLERLFETLKQLSSTVPLIPIHVPKRHLETLLQKYKCNRKNDDTVIYLAVLIAILSFILFFYC